MGRRHSHCSASHILFPILMFDACFRERNNKNIGNWQPLKWMHQLSTFSKFYCAGQNEGKEPPHGDSVVWVRIPKPTAQPSQSQNDAVNNKCVIIIHETLNAGSCVAVLVRNVGPGRTFTLSRRKQTLDISVGGIFCYVRLSGVSWGVFLLGLSRQVGVNTGKNLQS